jgi:hypothetical protein
MVFDWNRDIAPPKTIPTLARPLKGRGRSYRVSSCGAKPRFMPVRGEGLCVPSKLRSCATTLSPTRSPGERESNRGGAGRSNIPTSLG